MTYLTEEELEQKLIDHINSLKNIEYVKEQAIHWLKCLNHDRGIQKRILEIGRDDYFQFKSYSTITPHMVLDELEEALTRLKGLDK